MELTIFAKNRTSKEGKSFVSYITKLIKKDGTTLTCSVKFRDECGSPKKENCPCNIIVERENANLSERVYDTETGERRTSYTLWVSAWREGEEYVDRSLDDFI